MREQNKFIQQIMDKLEKINLTDSHNKNFSRDGETDQPSIASKTQGTRPGAHEASPTEEATIESAMLAGRDKEGAQSLNVASPGYQETTLHRSCSQWGGASSSAANSTTSAPRRRGAARRAATCRDDKALLRSSQSQGQPLGQFRCG